MPRKVTLRGQRCPIARTRDEEVLKVIKEDGQTSYLSRHGCSCPGFVFSLLRRGKGTCSESASSRGRKPKNASCAKIVLNFSHVTI